MLKIKGFKIPNYDNSTASIVNSVLAHFGAEPIHKPLKQVLNAARGADKIVFFIVDALGYNAVKTLPKQAFLRKWMQEKPVSAVFPPTTSTSAVTFATGMLPIEHGVLGYMQYIPEKNKVVNMLQFKTIKSGKPIKLNLQKLYPFRTVYQTLKKAGIMPFILMQSKLKRTQLSAKLNAGAKFVAYKTIPEMFTKLKRLISKKGKAYIYAYLPDYDSACHEYGPDAIITNLLLAYINNQFTHLARAHARKTLLIISADHGAIKTNPDKIIKYQQHPRLYSALKAVSGEARINYLHCKKGKKEFVHKYFRKKLAKHCYIVPSEEAIAKGLFGKGNVNPLVA
ncbi:MAG: alkaline phosphatase family protein, partial [Candidatus Woesearchaeota archaeon]